MSRNIEIALNEKENDLSDVGSEYAPTIPFETSSDHSLSSHVSEIERRAWVVRLKVEEAKKEAKCRQEEERKQAEIQEEERQIKEGRHIRELEYKEERLRLDAQLQQSGKRDELEVLKNRLRDFEDSEPETECREVSIKKLEKVDNPVPEVPLSLPFKLSTVLQSPPNERERGAGETEERLDLSWNKELSNSQYTFKE